MIPFIDIFYKNKVTLERRDILVALTRESSSNVLLSVMSINN